MMISGVISVFYFDAGPSARGRQLYCRARNLKNMLAPLDGSFYTCYASNIIDVFLPC